MPVHFKPLLKITELVTYCQNWDRRIVVGKNMFGLLEIGIWILFFDQAQDGESFDFAQERGSVERLVEPFDNCH